MHELSIAQAIVDIAARHARGARVERVRVRVGHLRQVVPSALAFAFELCAHGTAVDGAELELEAVAARVACRACGAESDPGGFPLVCGACGGLAVDVVGGDELQVESLDLQDDLVTTNGGVGDEH